MHSDFHGRLLVVLKPKQLDFCFLILLFYGLHLQANHCNQLTKSSKIWLTNR